MNPATLSGPQQALTKRLRAYHPAGPREEEHRRRILAQVVATPMWWHRDTRPGHVTGSAFVLDPRLERMLLLHHRKLDRWLQPGGHDDGQQDPSATALREAQEETGLTRFAWFGGHPAFFDLDVHVIPALGEVSRHLHLDVRYLLQADPDEPLILAREEGHALEWLDLPAAAERMPEEGARRVMRKIHDLRLVLARLSGSS
ncbi:MAG: NUDIX hydrolase [Planctomycetota bacterium]